MKLLGKIADHTGLLVAAFLVTSFITTSFAQPTINPEETVNIATGEMGFSLPLGTVKDPGGLEYPVNLSYKAGIRTTQEASEVGLGFSCGGGEISRKVVFVPDDNIGGVNNCIMEKPNVHCGTPEWLLYLRVGLFAAGMFLLPFAGVGGVAGMIINTASVGLGVVDPIASSNWYSQFNYSGGGGHTPVYDYDAGKGVGFLRGGDKTDLPDVYFISTPYLSGEMVWVQENGNGHFVMQAQSGNNNAVKIKHYDKTVTFFQGTNKEFTTQKMVFEITLQDGTRLIFDELSAASSYIRGYSEKRVSVKLFELWNGKKKSSA